MPDEGPEPNNRGSILYWFCSASWRAVADYLIDQRRQPHCLRMELELAGLDLGEVRVPG